MCGAQAYTEVVRGQSLLPCSKSAGDVYPQLPLLDVPLTDTETFPSRELSDFALVEC